MRKTDLHVHTTGSDGLLSPEEVVALCRDNGVVAVAIADHDTVAGVRHLKAAADRKPGSGSPLSQTSFFFEGVEIIPAVEINTELGEKEVHILGYFIPLEGDSEFDTLLEILRQSRTERVRLMLSRLGEMGLPLELRHVEKLARGESVGRPHVGKAMVEKGYVSSVREAFEKYLGVGKPAYVPRTHLAPVEAVRAITRAGGVAVWAHPATSGCDDILDELVDNGLCGLECIHPRHSSEDVLRYSSLARDLGLIATGGSDYHGPGSDEGGELGEWVVDYSVVELLRNARRRKTGNPLDTPRRSSE